MMSITRMLILLIVASGIMVGIGAYYLDIQNVYNPTNTTSSGSFRAFNESFKNTTSLLEDFQDRTVGIVKKGILDPSKYSDVVMAFVDVAGVVINVPATATLFVGHIFDILPGVPIPDWFISIIFTVVIIIVTMKIVGIFTKMEEV